MPSFPHVPDRIRRNPWVCIGVVGSCLAVLIVSVYFVLRGWQVTKANNPGLFHNPDGSLNVKWTLPDGSDQVALHPDQEHREAIFESLTESVWYHPAEPGRIVFYGKQWPVPYVWLSLIAIALPVLVAFLLSIVKK